MARIRNIKPQFFKDAELFDAEEASGLPLRVAYAGLWTVADRAGRFRWKPREIKTDILPYDNLDMSAVMDALVKYGFIFKYKVAGFEYGFIPNFEKHQFINRNEAQSALPAPSENSNAQSLPSSAPTACYEYTASSDTDILDTDSISAVPASTPIRKPHPKVSFPAFYQAYPKHVAKGAALKAYIRACSRASPEVLLAGAQRYAMSRAREDPQFTQNPATWLNADCWLDEDGKTKIMLDPEKAAALQDRSDQLMRRGKYAVDFKDVA